MIYTIGHSTHSAETFLGLLTAHGIGQLADIRTIPKSRRHPHFGREQLDEFLGRHDIQYRHFPALGGLRKPRADSINTAWQHPGFRGYADYMQTEAFVRALDELLGFARDGESGVVQPRRSCAQKPDGGNVTVGCSRMHFWFAMCRCGTSSRRP